MDLNKLMQLEENPQSVCDECPYRCVKELGDTGQGGELLPAYWKKYEKAGERPPRLDVLLVVDYPRRKDIKTSPLLDFDAEFPAWKMLNLVVAKQFDSKNPWGHGYSQKPLAWGSAFATQCKPSLFTKGGAIGGKDKFGKLITKGKRDKAPRAKASKKCASLLKETIKRTRPRVIMSFGKDGLAALGIKATEKDNRGHIFPINSIKYDDGTSPVAILTYKPSNLLDPKQISLMSVWERDFEKARDIVENGYYKMPREEMIKDYIFPKTIKEIEDLCTMLEKEPWLASDIETSGLSSYASNAQFKIISFGWGKGKSAAFFIDHKSVDYKPKDAWKPVLKLFKTRIPIAGHNFKFDLKYMLGLKYTKPGDVNLMWDTMLGAFWLDENRALDNDESDATMSGRGELGLKTLTWDYHTEYGGYDDLCDMKSHFKKGTEPAPQEFLEYAAMDTDVGWQEAKRQMDTVAALPDVEKVAFHRSFYGTLMPATMMAVEAENFGINPNVELIENLQPRVAIEIYRMKVAIEERGRRDLGVERFSISSPDDMKAWLFGPPSKGGLGLEPVKKTSTGAPSLDKDAVKILLQKYESIVPELRNYGKWAKLSKLQTTYLTQPLDFTGSDGRVHCNMVLHGARTGRISIQDPPMQTLSKKLGAVPEITNDEQARITRLFKDGLLEDQNIDPKVVDLERYEAAFQLDKEGKPKFYTIAPKSLYCAPEGYELVGADLSQIEVVIAACKAQEWKMLRAIDLGLDMHCTVGSNIYHYDYDDFVYWTKGAGIEIPEDELTPEQLKKMKRMAADRGASKTVSFGVLYGMSPYTLKDGLPYTEEEKAMEDIELDPTDRWALQPKDASRLQRARDIFSMFLGEFPQINTLIETCHVQCLRDHQVISEFGRIRRFPILKYILGSGNWRSEKCLKRIVAACKRQSANAPIQGLASDMCLKSMRRVHLALKPIGGSALLPVHDFILGVAPKGNSELCYQLFKEAMLEWPREYYPSLIRCNLKSDFEVDTSVPSTWGGMSIYKGD